MIDAHGQPERRPFFGNAIISITGNPKREAKSYMATKNRIFISFAAEDARSRDLLVGQARNEDSPFEFVDMSVKEPWDEAWKTRCRSRIRSCDGVIVLIGQGTYAASGACWEMQCANDEKIPMLGVHISKDRKGPVPTELSGKNVIEWTWPGIAAFIDGL